ncbi:unnamed protein product [Nezara viridula]|uniref:Scavenger receptor class B member 1 n=1 Tax=Nezara viridula TaxID=85310 RepID=A0A9P0MVE7_NEZVI|nr:unnamed protein product [Nezara viridula]
MEAKHNGTTLVLKMKDYCPSNECSLAKGIVVCTLLSLLFIGSFSGACLMWFTEIYYDEIINQLTIRDGSDVYEAWRKPPVKPLICVHVFNYTNFEEYAKKIDKKLKIEEVGPYCYRETLEKKNVTFSEDGKKVTYGDTRKHKFEPSHSKGSKDDILVVPNLALIGTIAVTKDMNRFSQIALSYFLRSLLRYSNSMITVKAHDFIFGYDDKLVELGLYVAKLLQRDVPFEKLGILSQRAADTDDTITVLTGTNDIENIGIVSEINGEDRLYVWPEEECNRIDGSDGAFFPRHTLNNNVTLYLFHNNMCRRMPFVYDKEVLFQGDVTAMRFHAAPDVYNTNGTCYCPESGCAPYGLFDLSPCSEGIPLLVSFPHFLNADPSISEPFEGLHPDSEKHEFYIDIQRLLGFTLGTVSRLQMNMRIEKSKYTNLLKEFPNNLILPLFWIQVSAEEMPPELYNIIYHSTFTVKRMQVVLRWGLLLFTLLLLYFLVVYSRLLIGTIKRKTEELKDKKSTCCQEMLPKHIDIKTGTCEISRV